MRTTTTFCSAAILLGLWTVGGCHSSSSPPRTSPDARDGQASAADARLGAEVYEVAPAPGDGAADAVKEVGLGADVVDAPADLPATADVADLRLAVEGPSALDSSADWASEVARDVAWESARGDADTSAGDVPATQPDALADRPSGDGAPMALDARVGGDGKDGNATPGPFRLAVAPNRMLDLVFMIDNSPSMAAKQAKLKSQFPRLIEALEDPSDGSLPDLRLAIIDSDLGTGGAYTSGSCGANDSNGQNAYGDLGKFRMLGATGCGVTDTNALWLEYARGLAINYTGGIANVFACLAANLGTVGCGEEHSLQALEFALAAQGIGNERQQKMLRSAAFLGLVLLTDEDDCSAATNDGMFGDKSNLRGEAASLRCATRAHACGGKNLTDAPPGYPTTGAFSAPFLTCTARTDDCPNQTDGDLSGTDTSGPTACSPLKGIRRLADEIKALKPNPDNQVFVAGIFGWPLSEADLATATYKIDLVPNPNTADTAHPQVYDSWPVCYDPNHLPGAGDAKTGFDVEAASWGATGGVRIGAFIDQFGDNGMKFSICQPDYAAAMSKIGAALSKKMDNLCVPARFGTSVGCTATYLVPDPDGNLVRDATAMPACNGSRSNQPCYSLAADGNLCPGSQYLVRIIASTDAGAPVPGTQLELVCP